MTIDKLNISYLESLLADMLNQFKGDDKPNTTVLLAMIADQLQALIDAAKETVTDTTLDSAVGAQLDGIGDIVKLTRKEAAVLANIATTDINDIDAALYDNNSSAAAFLYAYADNGIIPFHVLDDDERYRDLLRFKVFLNNSEGTYADMMHSIATMWNATKIKYSEDVMSGVGCDKYLHATVMLSTEDLSPCANPEQDRARMFFTAPIVKAAGVTILRKAQTVTPMPEKIVRTAGRFFNPIMQTALPMLRYDIPFNTAVTVKTRVESVAQTVVPEAFPTHLKYELCEGVDGYYYEVIGVLDSSLGMDITIPTSYRGIPVTSIRGKQTEKSAFADSVITSLRIHGCCALNGSDIAIRSRFLERIYFEEGITTVPPRFAGGCVSLDCVFFPRSLQSIGVAAFPSNIKPTVYYAGSQEEWQQVSVASSNGGINAATIIFNYHEED